VEEGDGAGGLVADLGFDEVVGVGPDAGDRAALKEVAAALAGEAVEAV
jgi:hypothetical protein